VKWRQHRQAILDEIAHAVETIGKAPPMWSEAFIRRGSL
jgi:hypothetical protein